MDDNGKAPRNGYSVEEILAEARINRERKAPPAPDKGRPAEEEILREARRALSMEAGKEEPVPPEAQEPEPPEDGGKKRRFSPFRRRKKREEFREEDDLYYGLQLKPLEEYRKEYEKTVQGGREPGDKRDSGSSFPYLFGREGQEPEDGMAETFERVHRERHERLERIMRQAGLDPEEILPQEEPARPPEIPPPGPVGPEVPVPNEPVVTPGPVRRPEVRPPATKPLPEPPGRPEIQSGERSGEAPGADSPAREDGVKKTEEQPPAPVREPEKPPQGKEERTPPPKKEPPEGPVPQYRASGAPVHFIRPVGLRELLQAEAVRYAAAPPEPIPLPKREEPSPAPESRPEPPKPEPDFAPEPPGGAPVSGPVIEENPPAAPPTPLHGGEEPAPPRPRERRRRFRLFGSEEADEPAEEAPSEQGELDDYTDPADAPSILHDLVRSLAGLSLRFAVTGISALLLLLVGILAELPALLPPELHSFLSGPSLPVVQLLFLLVAAGFSFPAVFNGLKGLTTFQANADTAAAAAVLAALIQNAVLLILGVPQGVSLYGPLAALALFLNAAGKCSMARRVLGNFRFVSSPKEKYAVRLYDDYNTSLRLAKGCVIGEPCIAYQSKAAFLRHFLRFSYEPDPAERVSQTIAPAGFLLSLALCIACAVLTGSASSALTAFAASCCICVPMANMLCVNLPVGRLNRVARRSGAMVCGWPAVRRFSEVNAVLLDAQDLFPRGTVVLNGIRTFAGQRIDEAILDAAALMCSVGGPLSDLFDQIIKSRREILPKIGAPAYEDGGGVTGTVSGRLILVGSRDLMKAHGIEPPSRDYEKKYLQSGERLVYLASEGTLVAMFIVTYRSDLRRSQELRRMERNGVSLIVRTCDPNVTPAFLSECFGLDEHSVSVLPEQLGRLYLDLVRVEPDRADALIATKGRPLSMVRLLTGCIRQRGNITVAAALQVAAVALGFALVAFLSLWSGLSQLSVTALSIYEAFWTAAILLVPRIRRP